jgi:transcriptional regulator with XRE-family HTH domain
MNDLSVEFYPSLGQRLKEVRQKAGLQEPAVAREMGFKPSTGQVFISRMEHGKAANVTLGAVVRYLQACRTPVGKFVEDKTRDEQAKRTKAELQYEKREAREARDADIMARFGLRNVDCGIPNSTFRPKSRQDFNTKAQRHEERAGRSNRIRSRLVSQSGHQENGPGAVQPESLLGVLCVFVLQTRIPSSVIRIDRSRASAILCVLM